MKKLHQPPEELKKALTIKPSERRDWINRGGIGGSEYSMKPRKKRRPIENHFENPNEYPWGRG